MTPLLLRSTRVLAIALCAGGVTASAAVPPHTITSLMKSQDSISSAAVPGMGSFGFINYPQNFTRGGRGVLKVSCSNAGAWLAHVDTPAFNTSIDGGILRSPAVSPPFIPYIWKGKPGYLSSPNPTQTPTAFHAMDVNSGGHDVLAMAVLGDRVSADNPSSGVYFDKSTLVFMQGDVLSAAGLAPGTTWNAIDASTQLALSDNNQLMVVSTVTESAASTRVVVRLQLDASGNIVGSTLMAKEGGPVGGGPDTWLSISSAAHSAAMNNSGAIVFSGVTAGGVDGVYSTAVGGGSGGFVASAGAPTPVAGTTWGSLAGSPADINSSGVVAFRGVTAEGSGVYAESTDAGEVPDAEDHTYGNGPLTRITGTLSSDWDVDLFRIVVTDAAAFSATTVPDPGAGFPGAAFDTVLSVIAEPGNGTIGRTQCDNVSASVPQSTVTTADGVLITGRSYYLAISTPKSVCQSRVWHYGTNSFPHWDTWATDPSGVAAASGMVYWPDPSAGAIGRATTGGAMQPGLAAPSITPFLAVDAVGGKIYWADRGVSGSGERIRRSDLDGSNVADVVTNASGLSASDCTGIALDLVAGKLYWSRSIFGEINRCDLDGANVERVILDYAPNCPTCTPSSFPEAVATGTFAPSSIAIDNAGGKVYWANNVLDRIERANLDGMGRQTLASGTGARSIALHTAAGKVYWANTGASKIQRSNLDGSAIEDVLSTPAPAALTLDASGGFVYWTNTLDRTVLRSPIATPAAATVVAIGPSIGEGRPDGIGATDNFASWARTGAEVSTPLPYQIKLTGAGFEFKQTMIVRGGQKVAAVGDAVPGVADSVLSVITFPETPVKLSDRGDVLWTGSFYPVYADNVPQSGLFFGSGLLLPVNSAPAGANINGQKVVYFPSGPFLFDMSPSGRYAIVQVNMQDPPFNFTIQRDNALLFEFNLCKADFNGDGVVSIDDLFLYFNAYFQGLPSADFNDAGGVTIDDLFLYINAYFTGC